MDNPPWAPGKCTLTIVHSLFERNVFKARVISRSSKSSSHLVQYGIFKNQGISNVTVYSQLFLFGVPTTVPKMQSQVTVSFCIFRIKWAFFFVIANEHSPHIFKLQFGKMHNKVSVSVPNCFTIT